MTLQEEIEHCRKKKKELYAKANDVKDARVKQFYILEVNKYFILWLDGVYTKFSVFFYSVVDVQRNIGDRVGVIWLMFKHKNGTTILTFRCSKEGTRDCREVYKFGADESNCRLGIDK